MAELHPLHPLRYTRSAGDLSTLTAPPYDVIDAAKRETLRAANPYNAVRLELPEVPYDQMSALIADWVTSGALSLTERPGVMAWQQTFVTREDGTSHTRHVILAAVVYFFVVLPYTKLRDKYFPEPADEKPADVALLEEIRDLLAKR